MPIVNRIDLLKQKVADALASPDLQYIGPRVPDDDLRRFFHAHLAGIGVAVKLVESLPAEHEHTHRMVWQPESGGVTYDNYFTMPAYRS